MVVYYTSDSVFSMPTDKRPSLFSKWQRTALLIGRLLAEQPSRQPPEFLFLLCEVKFLKGNERCSSSNVGSVDLPHAQKCSISSSTPTCYPSSPFLQRANSELSYYMLLHSNCLKYSSFSFPRYSKSSSNFDIK
jgi:hypothetical protein